ncbi:hypothetical protein WE687_004562 [Escherichia coli H46]|uniref:hypothetical protein n=1 Tax=Escherichia coli TaxID=562 RepID=UPI000647C3FC|nr:hypothetical protein [Escherichia coli]EFP0883435.1 hypothetical protein [Escherichia coli]MCH7052223.1 hypothetical protein [Escherichia coli]MCI4860180.1 hypothetical protein [Escherichia coli]HAV9899302.1 hypothetical protein [Escherichia coli]HCO6475458.1 hypothetical protein [Escherichia coli]
MKLKKLPGFSLGLIALAVGNAYADQFIHHDEYKHAVEIKDGEVKDIDNALVITTVMEVTVYLLQERVAI